MSCSWVVKGEHENSYELVKKTVEAATDFSCLSRGDRVLIKMALNSGNPYPATTDPWSVKCMVKLLKEKGAGKILVGDQSGFDKTTTGFSNSVDAGFNISMANHKEYHPPAPPPQILGKAPK